VTAAVGPGVGDTLGVAVGVDVATVGSNGTVGVSTVGLGETGGTAVADGVAVGIHVGDGVTTYCGGGPV
jgi:hypothetical protein